MITRHLRKSIGYLALGSVCLASGSALSTELSSVPLPTYSAPSTVDVKPNIFFVLDDSGSMAWDFMPDNACISGFNNDSCGSVATKVSGTAYYLEYLFKNSTFNGIYYDPSIRYTPPVYVNSSGDTYDYTSSTSIYPSMTGTSSTTGADTSSGNTLPNWKAVKNDIFGIQDTGTSDLQTVATHSSSGRPPLFFTTIATQYCTSASLKTCKTASAPDDTYKYPLKIRYCQSDMTTCRATFDQSYTYPLTATPSLAIIDIASVKGQSTTAEKINSIKVGTKELMTAAVTASNFPQANNATSVANAIVGQINACTVQKTGSCSQSGYHAFVVPGGSNNGVTTAYVYIIAPSYFTTTTTPTVSAASTTYFTYTPHAFNIDTTNGQAVMTVITPDVNSYPFPGSTTKAVARTDCAGTTCTYNEEMTNYANWWAYYHTRMQMMKTSVSNAFSTLDSTTDIAAGKSKFRVGYMTINNNNSDFLNVGEFTKTQKYTWYHRFVQANPSNSTPLRQALSTIGRIYAGEYDGKNFGGDDVVDPLQYSCQQNYTILSTDGFWNESSSYAVKIDGSTQVGNQDGDLIRPYNDGGSSVLQKSTSQLQQRTVIAQKSTLAVQATYAHLQTQTGTGLQQETMKLQQSTMSTNGSWGSWTDVTSSCTWKTPVKSSGKWSGTQCQYVASTSWTNVSSGASCSATVLPTDSSNGAVWTYSSSNKPKACQYKNASSWTGVQTCTPNMPSTSGSVTTYPNSAVACQTVTDNPVTVSTCTVNTTPDSQGNTTTACNYASTWSSWSDATSGCTAVAQSTSAPYVTAVQCSNDANSTSPAAHFSQWTTANTCDATGSSIQCQYSAWSAFANASSCTEVAPSTGPQYTVAQAVHCQNGASGGNTNTLADVASYYYRTDLRSPTANFDNMSTGPCISPVTGNNVCTDNVKGPDSDPAAYQHMTTFTLGLGAQGEMIFAPQDGKDYWNDKSGDFYDVKNGTIASPSTGVCVWQTSGNCNWPTPVSNQNTTIDDLWHAAVNGHGTYFSAKDPASLAAGLASTLKAISNVPMPGTAAAAASSNPNVSSSDNFVFSSSYKSVDWYGELIRQRINDDGTLTAENWSAMRLLDCRTTTWQQNTSYAVGDTFQNTAGTKCYVVISAYTSGATFGDKDTTGTGGTVQILHVDETASPTTDVTPAGARTIFTRASDGTKVDFTWTGLTAASMTSYFTTPAITASGSNGLSQFCASGQFCLSSAQQTAASGQALVDFLRGVRTYEGTSNYFRARKHVLGDIVSSEGRYVKAPLFNYADAGFADYKTNMASRQSMVYVAANDGMLHAFSADNGQETWAYVPGLVLPDLYRLADRKYSDADANLHRFFVDGTPEVGDICPTAPATACTGSQWKTILVGGLNLGGKGYYALDITDPANPKPLWEFTDANMGYSYGNPKVGKLKDGTWVVLLTSGYNNADGLGHLYVVNANTGALIREIKTSAGTGSNPSGLARISAHVTTPMSDNTAIAAYGGDTLGNLWRFDINGDIGATGYDAQLLVSFVDDKSNVQPITAKPLEATIDGHVVVFVGTGRYLGVSDIADTSYQAFYAVKDNYDSTTLPNPRIASSNFIHQVMTSGTCPAGASVCDTGQSVRTGTSNPVDWSVKNGWYVDFLTGGERASTDPTLGLGTLLFTTITPNTASANACGDATTDNSSSYLYMLNYLTGGALDGSNVVSVSLGTGLVTRPVMIERSDGVINALIRSSGQVANSSDPLSTDLGSTKIKTPIMSPNGGSTVRRVSWRELPTK